MTEELRKEDYGLKVFANRLRSDAERLEEQADKRNDEVGTHNRTLATSYKESAKFYDWVANHYPKEGRGHPDIPFMKAFIHDRQKLPQEEREALEMGLKELLKLPSPRLIVNDLLNYIITEFRSSPGSNQEIITLAKKALEQRVIETGSEQMKKAYGGNTDYEAQN